MGEHLVLLPDMSGKLAHFGNDEDGNDHRAEHVGNGRRVQNTIKPKEQGENDNQRDEQQKLP